MSDVDRQVEPLALMMTDVEGSTSLRLDRGDVVANQILRHQERILRQQLRRLLRTRAGLAAAAGGRWDDAERWLTEALDEAQRQANELGTADVRRLHARVLRDRGRPEDRARATDLLRSALDAYTRFGMPTYAAEAERMLAEGPAPARNAP